MQQRNVLAAPALGQPSTAQRLFHQVQSGGASAAGLQATGLTVGARADCVVLDAASPALLGVPVAHTLDALIFASDVAAVEQVFVAGQCAVQAGRHTQQTQIADNFTHVMRELWRK